MFFINKKFSTEWKKFIFINIFACLIQSSDLGSFSHSVLGNKTFMNKLLNIEILTKTNLLKLKRLVPFEYMNASYLILINNI